MDLKELFAYTAFIIEKMPDAGNPRTVQLLADKVAGKIEELPPADQARLPGKTSAIRAVRLVKYMLQKDL